jgi:hypothetical protein
MKKEGLVLIFILSFFIGVIAAAMTQKPLEPGTKRVNTRGGGFIVKE